MLGVLGDRLAADAYTSLASEEEMMDGAVLAELDVIFEVWHPPIIWEDIESKMG